MYTQKMHEVQKYITETNHGYIGYVVVIEQEILGWHSRRYARASATKP